MPRQSKEKKVINGVGTGRRTAPARGGDAYSAPAVYVKEAGLWKIYYICRDYLGSITHIANADGTLKAEYSYDAWGRLRNPVTQIAYTPGTEPALFLFSALFHLTFICLSKSEVNKINFVVLGVPNYKSYVFTRKEE